MARRPLRHGSHHHPRRRRATSSSSPTTCSTPSTGSNPIAAKLGCPDELADVEKIISRGAGYQRQRRVAAESGGDLQAVVLDLVKQMRNGPTA